MLKLRPHLLAAFLVFALPLHSLAEFPTTRPFSGITYGHAQRSDPPMQLYWVIVDLGEPAVSLRVVPGGPDPDGDGPYETVLCRPSEVAAREALDIAVNGDFFSAKTSLFGSSGYFADQWAKVTGAAMTDGRRWSPGRADTPCLVVSSNGKPSIVQGSEIPADARQVISGNVFLIRSGKKVQPSSQAIHPRTVVGLDQKHQRLVLLVVDGRQPAVSIGMSYSQLADEMLRLGCDSAINLDGGGSSALVMYDRESRQFRVLNHPSDGAERPVANVLGIRAKGGSATTRATEQN